MKGVITRTEEGTHDASVPRYLVRPASFPITKSMVNNPIRIIDFGQSFLPEDKPDTLHTPMAFRAPEVLLGLDWDYRVDLCSLGFILNLRIYGIVDLLRPESRFSSSYDY